MATQQHDIKNHAITRAGYIYQDLICLKYLIEFYRDPSLYEWVEVEAPDPKFAAIDDFVALRKADQKYVLKQVKFTVQPEREDLHLTWEWLLRQRGNGTSCLQKWSKTLLSERFSGRIHSAQLVTNKIPDPMIESVLEGLRINYKKIDRETKAIINQQLGSRTAAKQFFEKFEFVHSEPIIDDLQFRLRDSIVPSDTDEQGWYILLEQVRKWSTRKNQPTPDGKIYYRNLSSLLSIKRPRSINQQFLVPADYVVPDTTFHKSVLLRIENKTRWTVVWGVPGRGKSTYLSNLIDELATKNIICIRHHYFVSMSDMTTDRISFDVLASSLMSQLKERFPEAVASLSDKPSNLTEWLEVCALQCRNKGTPLVLIVDGLDHVWRGGRDIQQMEQFFKHISAVNDNLLIVVGTQKVSDKYLPVELLNRCPKPKWLELPALNRTAIEKWVRLKFKGHEYSNSAIVAISKALHTISNGHPLHLIYTIEYSIRNNILLNEANILTLPECPEGDIEKYYQSLWNVLNKSSKNALHIMAGSQFNWPSLQSVKKVVSYNTHADDLDDIDHLIDRKTTEIVPFHGSIFAWVRSIENHRESYLDFSGDIIKWLETDAPEYWVWAYLWTQKYETGNHTDFLQNVGRPWALKSIMEGRPLDVIRTILDIGERACLDNNNYGKAVELRSIKTRIYNGPSYQTYEYPIYQEAVWSGLKSSFSIEKLFNDLRDVSNQELFLLSLNKHILAIPDAIDRIHEEFKIRQTRLFGSKSLERSSVFDLIECVVKFISHHERIDAKDIFDFTGQFKEDEGHFLEIILQCLIFTRNVTTSLSMASEIVQKSNLCFDKLSEVLVKLASLEGFDLAVHAHLQPCFQSSMYIIWHHQKHGHCPSVTVSVPDIGTLDSVDIEYGVSRKHVDYFNNMFLSGLAQGLGAQAPDERSEYSQNASWFDVTSRNLYKTGVDIGKEIQSGKSSLSFSTIYELSRGITSPEISPNDTSHRHYSNFRIALSEIAVDCAYLGLVKNSSVTLDQMEIAISSTHWVEDIWLETFIKERHQCFSKDAIEVLIRSSLSDMDSQISPFDERSLKYSRLSCLAYWYNLSDLAEKLVRVTTENIFGYGYRKDYWLWSVLDAVRFCAESGKVDVEKWLPILAAIVDGVDDFTDGDEIPLAKEMLGDLLIASKPDLLPVYYDHLISKEEWSTADNVLRSYFEAFDYGNPFIQAVSTTISEAQDATLIIDSFDRPSKSQLAAVALLKKRNGFSETTPNEQKLKTDPPIVPGIKVTVSDFQPFQFNEFWDALKKNEDYSGQQLGVSQWITYWERADKGSEVLEAFEVLLKGKDRVMSSVAQSLDLVAGLALKHQGKTAAFKWYVLSHIENNGWSRWQGDEERQMRLNTVANLFPQNWQKFISETASRDRYRSNDGLVFGSDYWVYFLLKCGEFEEAERVTDSMVNSVRLEMADQPIGDPSWFR